MVTLGSPVPQNSWWGLGHGHPGVKGGKTLSSWESAGGGGGGPAAKPPPTACSPTTQPPAEVGSEPAVLHSLLERILRQLFERLGLCLVGPTWNRRTRLNYPRG